MSNPESYARISKTDVLAFGANADEVVKNVRNILIYENVPSSWSLLAASRSSRSFSR